MALAICLLFDRRSDRLIRELWARLEAGGVGTLASHTHGQHHPHLSYAVLRQWDLDAVQEALGRLPRGGPVELSCQGVLLFPRGRVALAPALDSSTFTRQQRVVEALASTPDADLHKHYLPGRWVPHVSVATRASGGQLADTVNAVTDALPIRVTADRAALIDSATGGRWDLPLVP